MAARRMPLLVEVPIATYKFFVHGDMPENLPSIDEIFPTTKPYVTKYRQQIESKQKVEQSRELARLEDKEEWRATAQAQRKVNRTLTDPKADFSVFMKVARLLADRKKAELNHLLLVGISGDGKDVSMRELVRCYKLLDPNAIFVFIDSKFKTGEFEHDNFPHFKGDEEAAIGFSEMARFTQARFDDPNYSSATSPKVIFVCTETKDVIRNNPDCVPHLISVLNKARGANVCFWGITQSYNAGSLGLEEPDLDTFVKIVLPTHQIKYIEKKLSHLSKPMTAGLKQTCIGYAQTGAKSALVSLPSGAPFVEPIPFLKHAFEEMESPNPPMNCPGLNSPQITRLKFEQGSGARHPIEPPVMTKPTNNGHDLDFPTPELWQTDEGDAWMLANHQHSINRNGTQFLGQGKAAARFGVGVEPTYRGRINELLRKKASTQNNEADEE